MIKHNFRLILKSHYNTTLQALTICLVFGLKLVLNMTFNLNETYFSEKFGHIWPRNRQKTAQIEVFGHFLDFASLVFLDFAHSDRWAWCLVVFLEIAGPVIVFLLNLENWSFKERQFFSVVTFE